VGPSIPPSVLDRLFEVAAEVRGPDDPPPVVHVVSIARIWGTALGLPHPGLYPNRVELEEQRAIVDTASAAVRRQGFEVKSRILSARNPAKAIALYAESIRATAVVLGDPAHHAKRWEHLLKGHDARDLIGKTSIPVHTVPIDEPAPQSLRRGEVRPAHRRPGAAER
jgi:hypothetical protein